jgi:hypothetical protein
MIQFRLPPTSRKLPVAASACADAVTWSWTAHRPGSITQVVAARAGRSAAVRILVLFIDGESVVTQSVDTRYQISSNFECPLCFRNLRDTIQLDPIDAASQAIGKSAQRRYSSRMKRSRADGRISRVSSPHAVECKNSSRAGGEFDLRNSSSSVGQSRNQQSKISQLSGGGPIVAFGCNPWGRLLKNSRRVNLPVCVPSFISFSKTRSGIPAPHNHG